MRLPWPQSLPFCTFQLARRLREVLCTVWLILALLIPAATWAGEPSKLAPAQPPRLPPAEVLAQQAATRAHAAAAARRRLRDLADDFLLRTLPHQALLATVDRWIAAGGKRAAQLEELVALAPALAQAERVAAACDSTWPPLLQAASPTSADPQIWDFDPALPGRVRWTCERLQQARPLAQQQFLAAALLHHGLRGAWLEVPRRYRDHGRLSYAQWQQFERMDQTMAERTALLQPYAEALGLPVPTSIFADGVTAREELRLALRRGVRRLQLPPGSVDKRFATSWKQAWDEAGQDGPFAGHRTLLEARWSPGPWQPLVRPDGGIREVHEVVLFVADSSQRCWAVWASAEKEAGRQLLRMGDDMRLLPCPGAAAPLPQLM
jgi:hypothetical protein